MRRIFLSQAVPDMVLAKDIIKADGRTLLSKGVVLTESYIEKLVNQCISFVYISDSKINLHIPDVILTETRQATKEAIYEVFKTTNISSHLSLEKILKQVNKIITEILEQKDILIHLVDIRSYDDYVYSHSVNVAVLTIITGIQMGLSHQELKELALGALLHDIGKTFIDDKILNKPALLTPIEYNTVKKHPLYGYEILQKISGLPQPVKLVALQHHEWYNGNGYPQGIKAKDIHLYARIVATIDVYDALTADRVYRKAFQPHIAIEHIRDKSYFHFDPLITKKFLENIAVYPIGSIVYLSNGLCGIVTSARKDIPARPKILVKWDVNHTLLSEPYEIDLTVEPSIQIMDIKNKA